MHFYGTNAKDFISYVEDMHNTFGRNIWVTEFACQNFSGGQQSGQQEVTDFMKEVIDFMDGADYVQQYFAFGECIN
jgi:O-glycosyl hydrolase